MYGIVLTWPRCVNGVTRVVRPRDRGLLDLEADADEANVEVFAYRSAKIESVRREVLNLEDPLAIRFLNASTTDQLETFIGIYGFLLPKGFDPWEAVPSIRRKQQNVLEMVKAAGSAEREEAVDRMNVALAYHEYKFGTPTLNPLKLKPSLEYVPGGATSRLVLEPDSLYDFMCVECMTIAATGARVTNCEHCGKFYLTGPLTGRRSHGRFCSDRCRVAAMRKRQAADAHL